MICNASDAVVFVKTISEKQDEPISEKKEEPIQFANSRSNWNTPPKIEPKKRRPIDHNNVDNNNGEPLHVVNAHNNHVFQFGTPPKIAKIGGATTKRIRKNDKKNQKNKKTTKRTTKRRC